MLEVELKFPLRERAAARDRLLAMGSSAGEPVRQSDTYYNHPSRDFAATDEAFRIRVVDGHSSVTYKGPKQGSLAKTRFELELPLAPQTAEGWAEVLGKLGFRRVTRVVKRRTSYRLERGGRRFEVSIDEVEGLGLFAEVETLASDSADNDDERGAAEQAVHVLAAELHLHAPEPRSYLEMLLGFDEPAGG